MNNAPIFASLAALADVTRARILLVLEQHPLSVSELCAVLQQPQSTISRHLKTLSEDNWVSARSEGASRVYRMAKLGAAERRLWQTVRDSITPETAGQEDAKRLTLVLEQRRLRSAAFFSAAAGQWDSVRRELFGVRADVLPYVSLLEPEVAVADLGCGTGQFVTAVAPLVRRVIGVDSSVEMIEAARSRIGGMPNAEVRQGQLELLPLQDGEVDCALLSLVLHYVVDPAVVLGEARRALRRGGRLSILDMAPHEREEYRETMGHVWLGFSPEQLQEWLDRAGFSRVHYQELEVDPLAKGPSLFVVRAVAS